MSEEPTSPRLKALDYRVVRSLGTGAGSTILLVADVEDGQQYALKVVRRQQPEDAVFVAQALHEFDVARRLNHPNLLRIHDCRVKRSWFRVTGVELLMEYVDGVMLDEMAKVDQRQLVRVFLDVAAALEHMHRRGVYHGDLKPGNIMVSRAGETRVLDFGTAWIKGRPKDRVQGTLQYMAPEQAVRKVVNERTDIYNFGATMYRMFTGQYANLGGAPQDLQGSLPEWARPRPAFTLNRSIPSELNQLIMDCLEHDPEARPSRVHDVRERLAAIARAMGAARRS